MFVPPHPNGYPQLGLAAAELLRPRRRDADAARTGRWLERWEHANGNKAFRVRGFERITNDVGLDLAHVYVSLRAAHPLVRPELLDVAARTGNPDVAASAVVYPLVFRHLRAVPHGEDEATAGRSSRAAKRELEYLGDTRSVHASGTIELSRAATSLRGQRQLAAFWQRRNDMRAATGLPCRLPPIDTSPAAFLLAHEFAHLADGELCEHGWERAEPVYATLSKVLLGVTDPQPGQWRNHLINYPTGGATSDLVGPRHRDRRMLRHHRLALARQIAQTVGSYAATNRDELFAETVALAHCGNEELRHMLRPALTTLRRHTRLTGGRR